MSNRSQRQRSTAGAPQGVEDVSKRSKQEWIEGAAALKRERFEIAGALFDCKDDELLSQQEVIQKVDAYLGLTTKEETENVDSAE